MDQGWQKYYQGLSRNLRKNLNKSIRYLQEEKGYQYKHKRGRDATLQDMETVFQINQKARHIYLYREQTEKAFHKELASLMADQGWLDLYFLYIGDVPAAFRYGFWYNQKYEAWRSGFDSIYSSFSAGRVILFLLIQEGFGHGMKVLDFLSGAEDFKTSWQVEARLFYHIRIIRREPLPLIIHLYFPQLKKKVKEFLDRHESLHPILKWIERLSNAEQNRRGVH
jgi:CelD/BcsL family acetyltransferase involved in cellulose biosynthesis